MPALPANPNDAAALKRAGGRGSALQETVKATANAFAESLAPVLWDIREHLYTTQQASASERNTGGIHTRRGGLWHVSTVRNLINRIDRLV